MSFVFVRPDLRKSSNARCVASVAFSPTLRPSPSLLSATTEFDPSEEHVDEVGLGQQRRDVVMSSGEAEREIERSRPAPVCGRSDNRRA